MKLSTFLETNGISEAAFARALGVSQVTVNRYCNDKRFPDPQMIERIFRATGEKVGVVDWYAQAGERRAKQPATHGAAT
jgi:transcriptional regulator with XRE-family HTH domain